MKKITEEEMKSDINLLIARGLKYSGTNCHISHNRICKEILQSIHKYLIQSNLEINTITSHTNYLHYLILAKKHILQKNYKETMNNISSFARRYDMLHNPYKSCIIKLLEDL